MVNVLPLNDECEHIKDTWCWCEPRVDYRDADTGKEYPNGPMIVHNSADGRETVERLLGEQLAPEKNWITIQTSE